MEHNMMLCRILSLLSRCSGSTEKNLTEDLVVHPIYSSFTARQNFCCALFYLATEKNPHALTMHLRNRAYVGSSSGSPKGVKAGTTNKCNWSKCPGRDDVGNYGHKCVKCHTPVHKLCLLDAGIMPDSPEQTLCHVCKGIEASTPEPAPQRKSPRKHALSAKSKAAGATERKRKAQEKTKTV